MRHLTAMHITAGGFDGWHFSCIGETGGWFLVGYCAVHAPHATEDEARRCFRQWQRDHVVLEPEPALVTPCAVPDCEALPRHTVAIRNTRMTADVCDQHWNPADAVRALRLDGDLAEDVWV